ncbi:MAG: hypothetical protein CL610_15265 [Anaerolineaceae bacterium]|nr:hypothetical protein [Anaerolineaceae bacterium]
MKDENLMSMFLQSLIDIDTWNEAKWRATAYFVHEDPTMVPALGIFFENERSAKQIFIDLIERLGKDDPYNELRIAVIEGEIKGQQGYSVHISSNPEQTIKRAQAQGEELDVEQILVVSRIHRMTPDPGSPHLSNFKRAFSGQGKYLLIPVTGTAQSINPHFDLAIGKTEILFRRVEDIDTNDRDAVIFA